MPEIADTGLVQLVHEGIGAGLVRVLCDDNAAGIEAQFLEGIQQPEYFLIITDAEIPA